MAEAELGLGKKDNVELDRLARRMQGIRRRDMFVGSILVFVPLYILMMSVGIWSGVSWIGYAAMAFAMSAIFFLQRAVTRRRQDELAGAILEVGICPSCGYSLEHIPLCDDGCVVCAECGHAWLGRSIKRFVPAAGGGADKPRSTLSIMFHGGVPRSYDVADDRGDIRPIVTARELSRIVSEIESPSATHHVVLEQLRKLGRGVRGVLAVLALFVYGFSLFGMLSSRIVTTGGVPPSASAFWRMVVTFSSGLFLVWMLIGIPLWLLRSGIGRSPREARNLLLFHELCATCARDLSEVSPEPDDRTVCPDCGAAWRMDEDRE